MIRKLTCGAIAATLALNVGAEEVAAPQLDAETIRNDASYALGYQTGANFSQQFGGFGLTPEDFDPTIFTKAFMKAIEQEEPDLKPEALQAAMQALAGEVEKREVKIGEANLAAGKSFLEENAKRDGVVTTESGLQYEVMKKGGEETYVKPTAEGALEKQFVVHYKGSLIDDKEFDASAEGEPTTMPLNVMPGLKEALTTMPVGARWKLFIPSELAYGERRQGAKIGPHSTVIFELELMEIQDAPPPQQGGFPFPMPGN